MTRRIADYELYFITSILNSEDDLHSRTIFYSLPLGRTPTHPNATLITAVLATNVLPKYLAEYSDPSA